MEKFYAICPFCKKSIFVEANSDGEYVCSVCGQTLDTEYLRSNDYVIDITAADEEYNAAQQYFINADFKEAETHFAKVLGYHRNHYLAEYYRALCEIYENEQKTDFDVPKRLVSAIVNSVEMLGLCQANIQARIEFLISVLNQANIILSSYFNRIYDNYEKTEMWDILRDKCLLIASAAKDVANIDKEQLMVFEQSIAKSLVSIADIGICACRKIVESHLINEKILDLPTDYQHERAKSYYGILLYYASSLDPSYGANEYKPDYTANLLFNQNTITKLNRYNSENKAAHKKYLSTPGEALEDFRKSAKTAIKFSYHTCFGNLSTQQTDQARIALINDSVSFCFELLSPRIYIDRDKKIAVDVYSHADSKDIAVFADKFLNEFCEYNSKLTADYVNKFYMSLHEKAKYHYTSVYAEYNKIVDKLKDAQNSEYRYYKNFLHNMIYACALALTDTLSFVSHPIGERLKTLKLGKQITDEFLLLNDYKVEELEQSAKYSDVLDIFNAFDRSIEELSARK